MSWKLLMVLFAGVVLGCGDVAAEHGAGDDSDDEELATAEVVKAPVEIEVPGWAILGAVALSEDGNTLVVGVPAAGCAGEAGKSGGAVYVYRREGGRWQAGTALQGQPCVDGARFGWAVAVSGDGSKIVVGAPGASSWLPPTPVGTAYAYAFRRNKWRLNDTIPSPASEGPDQFGSSVAMSGSGDTLAVGRPAASTVQFYAPARTSSGWAAAGELAGSVAGFGSKLAMSGDGSTLAVAGWANRDGGVAVYGRDGSAPWSEKFSVELPAAPSDSVALALSARGNDLVVGHVERRSGKWWEVATVYERASDGVWSVKASQLSPYGAGNIAVAMSSDGRTVVVGHAELGVPRAGERDSAVYVIRKAAAKWRLPSLLAAGKWETTGPARITPARLGEAVAVSSDGGVVVSLASGGSGPSGKLSIYD
jgi:FG-GAP repeat